MVTTFHDISPSCCLVIDPVPYVPRQKLHFVHSQRSINEVLKSAEPISDRPASVNSGPIHLEPFVIGAINVLVQKTSTLESKAIKINPYSTDVQKECPKTYGNVSFYWEKSLSVVWITGIKGDVASTFENIQLFLENGTKLPELFPKSAKTEIIPKETVQTKKVCFKQIYVFYKRYFKLNEFFGTFITIYLMNINLFISYLMFYSSTMTRHQKKKET